MFVHHGVWHLMLFKKTSYIAIKDMDRFESLHARWIQNSGSNMGNVQGHHHYTCHSNSSYIAAIRTPPAAMPSNPQQIFVAPAPLEEVLLAADAVPVFALAPVVAAPEAPPVAELPPTLVLPLDGVFVVACAALPVIGPGPCGPEAV
jgi:hypothetical protein